MDEGAVRTVEPRGWRSRRTSLREEWSGAGHRTGLPTRESLEEGTGQAPTDDRSGGISERRVGCGRPSLSEGKRNAALVGTLHVQARGTPAVDPSGQLSLNSAHILARAARDVWRTGGGANPYISASEVAKPRCTYFLCYCGRTGRPFEIRIRSFQEIPFGVVGTAGGASLLQ